MGNENGQSAAKHLASWYDSDEGSTTILVGGVPIRFSRFDWEKVDFDGEEFFVYCLAHPKSFEIRYVGITTNYQMRLRSHKFNHKDKTWKVNWVNKLQKDGLNPLMLQLNDPIKGDNKKALANECETGLIQLFAEHGFKLVNHEKLVSTRFGHEACGKHKNKKSVYQYFHDGRFLMKWNSLKEVVDHYEMSYPTLSSAISRKNKSFGFYWSLKRLDKFILNPSLRKKKKCFQYDLKGNFICEFSSIAEASRMTGIDRNCIKDNIKGRQMSAKKTIFSDKKKSKIKTYCAKYKRYESIIKEDIV